MKYELMVILDPRKTEKELEKNIAEIKKIFTENDLKFIEEDVWGTRKLAYKVKGFASGYYVVMTFEGEQEGLPEIHKDLRLMPELVRYLLQKEPDSYSLMRYDAKAVKVEASDHVKELQERIMKKDRRNDEPKKEEKVAIKEEEAPEPEPIPEPVEEKPAKKAEKEEAKEETREETKEETNDKLDAKLKAIIDDTDINF